MASPSRFSIFLFLSFMLLLPVPPSPLPVAAFRAEPSSRSVKNRGMEWRGSDNGEAIDEAGAMFMYANSDGVVRSTPARHEQMPSYNQNSAPVPLPEFPTLPPPLVWSFPAAPLPSETPPPPHHDLPVYPGTGSAPSSPPPPMKPWQRQRKKHCGGGGSGWGSHEGPPAPSSEPSFPKSPSFSTGDAQGMPPRGVGRSRCGSS